MILLYWNKEKNISSASLSRGRPTHVPPQQYANLQRSSANSRGLLYCNGFLTYFVLHVVLYARLDGRTRFGLVNSIEQQ